MAKRLTALINWAAILGILATLFLLPHHGAGATDHLVLENDGLAVIFEEATKTTAGHVVEIYPKIREDLEDLLGWKLRSRPVVRLVANRDTFAQMSGSPHFSAFAVPQRSLMVMFVAPAAAGSLTLSETLKHELCHLLLHDYIQDSLLPKWLDEGVCQWVSGSLGEILSGGGFPDTEIALAARPIPLRRLTYSFPRDRDLLFLAYEESRRFVEYLTATYGRQGLLAILKHLREGEYIDRAISGALSRSFEALEREWLDSVRRQYVWLIWASRHLYDILFVIAAILTVVAFISLVIRRKRYREEEDEE